MTKGTVYWITGLAGSGKTTLGQLLRDDLMRQYLPTVFLDGDELREVYGEANGAYDVAARKNIAFRNARLCKLLSDQGFNVVCSTISLFWDCQAWNRLNIENYKEIFLKVPKNVLNKRRTLYATTNNTPVVGREIPIEEPQQPDVILNSDGTLSPDQLLQSLKITLGQF